MVVVNNIGDVTMGRLKVSTEKRVSTRIVIRRCMFGRLLRLSRKISQDEAD